MTCKSSWEDLAAEFKNVNQADGLLRADWFAFEKSENYGIWIFHLDGRGTPQVRAAFCLIASRAIDKLGIPPIPTPQPLQHDPQFRLDCQVEEESVQRGAER